MRPDRFDSLLDQASDLSSSLKTRETKLASLLATVDNPALTAQFTAFTKQLYKGLEKSTRRLRKLQRDLEAECEAREEKLRELAETLEGMGDRSGRGSPWGEMESDSSDEDSGSGSGRSGSCSSSDGESERQKGERQRVTRAVEPKKKKKKKMKREREREERTDGEKRNRAAAAVAIHAFDQEAAIEASIAADSAGSETSRQAGEEESPAEHDRRLQTLGATLKAWREKAPGGWKGKGRMSDFGPSTHVSTFDTTVISSAAISSSSSKNPFAVDPPFLTSEVALRTSTSLSKPFPPRPPHHDRPRPRLSVPLPQNPRISALASSSSGLPTSTSASSSSAAGDLSSSSCNLVPLVLSVEPSPFNPLANASNKRRRYNEVEGGGKKGGFFERLRKEGDGLEGESSSEEEG